MLAPVFIRSEPQINDSKEFLSYASLHVIEKDLFEIECFALLTIRTMFDFQPIIRTDSLYTVQSWENIKSF